MSIVSRWIRNEVHDGYTVLPRSLNIQIHRRDDCLWQLSDKVGHGLTSEVIKV